MPLAGWMVSLTEEGAVIDTEATGSDGCYTWSGLYDRTDGGPTCSDQRQPAMKSDRRG